MNLDPQQIEDLFGIPKALLINWENSAEIPKLSDIEMLSNIYKCPVGFFFMENPPILSKYDTISFRGLSSSTANKLSYKTRLKINEFLTLTDKLASIKRELPSNSYPNIPEANLNDNIVDLARRERKTFDFNEDIRKSWHSANEAFNYWKHEIENSGVYVISLRLESHEVRGASRWYDKSVPAILVNTNTAEAATGRTFTLLHEWAHLLLKEPGIICDFIGSPDKANVETFANKFAAETLAPKAEIEQFLKVNGLYEYSDNWSDSIINHVKDNFRVSKDVIAISLTEMGLAPKDLYKNKRQIWDTHRPFFRSSTISRPGTTRIVYRYNALGAPFSNIVVEAYKNNHLQPLDLAALLNTKVDKIPDFLTLVATNREK
jgi:Zn-dependent peptidase ImmA (M78 family)